MEKKTEGMNEMNYSTLLMDADDTIFDFPKCEAAALRKALLSFGLSFDRTVCEAFSRINTALWKQFEQNRITRGELRVRRFQELLAACFDSGVDSAALADCYVEALSEQAILLEGAREALEKLSERFSIDIITNGLTQVQKGRFALAGLEKTYQKLFISDEMGVGKPGKAFFDAVLAEIPEKNRRRILVVGDSLTSDMQGGRNSGLDTCLYDPKGKITLPHPLCDYRIGTLEELMSFAAKKGEN